MVDDDNVVYQFPTKKKNYDAIGIYCETGGIKLYKTNNNTDMMGIAIRRMNGMYFINLN